MSYSENWRKAKMEGSSICASQVGGPVYWDDNDEYYQSIDSLLEVLEDDEIDPNTALVFPCTVTKAGTPDLVQTVEESWYENFEEPDAAGVVIPKHLLEQLNKLQVKLEHAAPPVWYPDTSKRIVWEEIE